ncbi:PhnA domain-containing protein [Lutibacter aestuarii]|uniref:PhnA domain-containing protein n=1 Tax=Lutibacter aestuarii TaxID=861111 RepID=A0ABW2Z6H2_9FLAO|nr:alkylphosphonate utilization protein [uncultured Lutibacter sp.]
MSIANELHERSGSKCELCGASEKLTIFQVPPVSIGGLDESLLACETCISQIENPELMDSNHWRCLNDSMWSEFDSVKVIVWRMLNRLKSEGWPQDLLEMMYLDDDTLKWAAAMGDGKSEDEIIKHLDCNGALLEAGDTITITKDLDVKGGGNFTAKRGTAVRNISLVHDNAEQIEGRINGVQIVILTKFVKKST